jgi:UDP-N-acetylglucosamine--N-acetylmuramyl-(pentapeptide) pyrophosphoryl-undecaprenol N-acetylglucosamine transferase
VLIAGGGTAGHVYPGLALARELRERDHYVAFAGTENGLEAALVPAAGFAFHVVRASPVKRKLSPATVAAPFVAFRAIRESKQLVSGFDVVVGMGGYVSVPAAVAAWRAAVPVALHEQNAVPGLANRLLAHVAGAVGVTFPESRPMFGRHARTTVTGNPVREEILRVREERDLLAKEAREELGFEADRKTVMIFGGSQGALHLDRAAVGACQLLRDRTDLQVLVITGPAHLAAVRRALPGSGGDEAWGLRVTVLGYLDRIELAYACADLVVARAGATTIAEISVCGLPAILIPYPYATARHQDANARSLQRTGGASVLPDRSLSAESLAERVVEIVELEERMRAMAQASQRFGRPDAAARLADLVLEAAR